MKVGSLVRFLDNLTWLGIVLWIDDPDIETAWMCHVWFLSDGEKHFFDVQDLEVLCE